MQTVAPAVENVATPHCWQTAGVVAPDTVEYHPAAHAVQVVKPMLKPNLPGAHASHGGPSADSL
jgi:hypothetical protein